jgi:3-dehydroquinate dehydratase / shikimate dehydrogenase
LIQQCLYHRHSPTAAALLVATLDEAAAMRGGFLRRLPEGVSWLQVRADLMGDIPPGRLREEFGGRLLYSLGGRGGAGGGEGGGFDRRRRLIAAAEAGYDLIDLDDERDIDEDVLAAIPPEKRLISWRGPASSASELASRFFRLSKISARAYALVVEPRRAADGLTPLLFLRSTARDDVIAYADGEMGLWSRVLAPRLGAPLVFCGGSGAGGERSDQPTLERMILDFGLPSLPAVDRICGIAGTAASRSLSPRLHNAMYRALGYPGLFLPFPVDSFAEFWRELVEGGGLGQIGLPLQALTVASPNKEIAATLANLRSRATHHSDSANLIFRRGAAWAVATTDPTGVLTNLRRGSVAGRRAAVVGCGGSGRAIAWALNRRGAIVTLVNRCRERGQHASRLLGLPFVPLAEFSVEGYDLIVNATPVGTNGGALPFPIDDLARDTIVVDLVYVPGTTALVADARARGARVVEGCQVLRAQVERQFVRMTGLDPPAGLAAEMLGLTAIPSAW